MSVSIFKHAHQHLYTSQRSLSSLPSFSVLRNELTQRRLPLFYDYLSPQQSHLLNLSLDDFIPTSGSTSANNGNATALPSSVLDPRPLPAGHHLVYFPPHVPSSQLLPDGTDTLHYPGPPFNRRMWAGGWVRFYNDGNDEPLLLNGQRAVCIEGIRDVSVKGKDGEEKVFVAVERRVAVVREGEEEEEIRGRVWTVGEEEKGDAVVVERRNLVFMRDREGGVEKVKRRAVKAPLNPDFSHALIPSRSLLFRFSALTFNAHSIHLDRGYAQNIEGYQDVLVHGPLTLTLMLTIFQNQISALSGGQVVIGSIEYRNLSPLFVEQEMRICAKRKGSGNGDGHAAAPAGAWDIWVEGLDGGLAVKGTVTVHVQTTRS
ncbi:uncharacterized protein PADG_05877 [Paracoccidioides brasiliensis Pb18]|uniref:Mesaconyl-C4 CoA hydratase n=1 Tax=Paracoccidioides brasiliensis (strain Pb18) TaxID=502780 RepID=C1GF41_PARBD|nr:uncharacterized protein PADG_05877 [Paracoccidioides brasiliensis Pb18]EEH49798.1 hypothetical protein PADG_05877 [Paracoccidioides brasiliensis Pb18]